VDIAADLAVPTGGTVILSPGAPSFDYYKNYADKAEHYRKLIEKRWRTS
jgi:UDP-N-acetylmuramoylalanine-D-glutamate ligase